MTSVVPLARVSVVVPHYRDFAALGRCLESVRRQTYPTALVEVIVADNASPEGEAAVVAVAGDRARVVVVTERGAGPTRNGGAAVATGEVIAFIDSDCVAEPQWLAEGVAALARFDFVGGRVRVMVDDMAHITPAEAFERVFAFHQETYIARKGFAVTANLFCPRALFASVGGFRVSVSEDMEWSFRARGLGFRLGYAADATVGHPARRTWPELITKWRRVNAETFALTTEREGGRLKWFIRTLALPASAVVHTPRVLASRELDTIGQRLAALGILYRLRFWRMGDAFRLLARGAGA